MTSRADKFLIFIIKIRLYPLYLFGQTKNSELRLPAKKLNTALVREREVQQIKKKITSLARSVLKFYRWKKFGTLCVVAL